MATRTVVPDAPEAGKWRVTVETTERETPLTCILDFDAEPADADVWALAAGLFGIKEAS